MTSAQLLVTDHDFRNKDFRSQLNETVQSLLALRVIPVFNENDAVSTRKAPYEACSVHCLIFHFIKYFLMLLKGKRKCTRRLLLTFLFSL